jgi:hypothetical protein
MVFLCFVATITWHSSGMRHLIGFNMKSMILQSLFGLALFCAALALMLAYFDVLVK